jgi:hypothetical protein
MEMAVLVPITTVAIIIERDSLSLKVCDIRDTGKVLALGSARLIHSIMRTAKDYLLMRLHELEV